MNAIETEALHKKFQGSKVAVDGIDLQVREGEIFGFLGPNGAGKTTTVRMLTTLLRPTSGQARVAGFDIYNQQHSIRRHIGTALQEVGLDGLATGRELVELQAKLFGFDAGEARRRADNLLTLVDLNDAADDRIQTYSGGMKRRLDLASALVHGPRLLFLDEPTEGLDPASRQTIWQEVVRLNNELGVTVFLTTHYMEEADRLADRLAIIDQGRIVASGTPTGLKSSIGGDVITVEVDAERLEQASTALGQMNGINELRPDGAGLTIFTNDGPRMVAQTIRALDAADIVVGSVAISRPTLDEVFLRATGYRLDSADEEGSG